MFKKKNKYVDEHYEMPIGIQLLIAIVSLILIVTSIVAFCKWDEQENNIEYIEYK